jgi:hypothetical protein
MTTETVLIDAIGTGELLTIIYHGGSQPGATREILPIKVTGNKVRARCYTSNAVKTFVIDKIELCKNQTATPATWDAKNKNKVKFSTISAVYKENKEQLESYGWHVLFSESSDGEEACLSLHTLFKNEKVRKTPKALLSYSKYAPVTIFDEETGEIIYTGEKKESTRPYYTQSRAFGKLDNAVKLFMENAEEKAPNKQGG